MGWWLWKFHYECFPIARETLDLWVANVFFEFIWIWDHILLLVFVSKCTFDLPSWKSMLFSVEFELAFVFLVQWHIILQGTILLWLWIIEWKFFGCVRWLPSRQELMSSWIWNNILDLSTGGLPRIAMICRHKARVTFQIPISFFEFWIFELFLYYLDLLDIF